MGGNKELTSSNTLQININNRNPHFHQLPILIQLVIEIIQTKSYPRIRKNHIHMSILCLRMNENTSKFRPDKNVAFYEICLSEALSAPQ